MQLENGQSVREAYLAELHSQVERLQAIIAAVESGGEVLPNGTSGGGGTVKRAEREVRPDSFYGLTTPQAVRKFLEMMGKGNPQAPTAIADALVRGGLENAGNQAVILKNIYTAFKRGKDTDFVKIGKLWGLIEWYPRKEEKPSPSKGKKKKKRAGSTAKEKPTGTPSSATAPAGGGFGAFNRFVQEYKKAGKSRKEAIVDWQNRKTD